MQNVISFITDGAKRENLLRGVQKYSGDQQKKLVKLCQTRFVERHVAVDRFWEQLPAIYHACQIMSSWNDRLASSAASTHLCMISRTEFLIGILIMKRFSSILRPLSVMLQSKGLDLMKALSMIESVRSIILKERADSEKCFNEVVTEAESMSDTLGFELSVPRVVARSTQRANAGDCTTVSSYYRINTFIPAVDAILQDLDFRFTEHHKNIYSLSLLVPRHRILCSKDKTFDENEAMTKLLKCWEFYGDKSQSSNVGQFKAELKVWNNLWENHKGDLPDTALEALEKCDKNAFPNISWLLSILAVLPVSTAEAERTFSKVTRTMTALRATMSEQRLESLILMQVHRDIIPSTEEILNEFASSGNRRLDLKLRI